MRRANLNRLLAVAAVSGLPVAAADSGAMADPHQQAPEPPLLPVVRAPSAAETEVVELVRVLIEVVALPLDVLHAAATLPVGGLGGLTKNTPGSRTPAYKEDDCL